MAVGEYRRCEWRRRGIRGKVSGPPVEREKEREAEMRDGLTQWGKRERNDGRNGERESDGGTRGREKIFANTRDDFPSGTGKEKDRHQEVEKTRTLKCHRAILIYGGREIGGGPNFEPESTRGRKSRNFCTNFQRRDASRMARDKKAASAPWPRRAFNRHAEGQDEKTRKS